VRRRSFIQLLGAVMVGVAVCLPTFADPAADYVDMSDSIHLLDPSKSPLASLAMRAQLVRGPSGPLHEWMEDVLEPMPENLGAQRIEVGDAVYWVNPQTGCGFRQS
jgi:hypothetical protein